MTHITATIQARMGSSRLPGKTLKHIMGRPMLWYQIQRLRQSRLIDRIVVATSTDPGDDPIVEACTEWDVAVFRGSEDDVLDRVISCLKAFDVDVHVECQGDNPIPDPHLVDAFIGYFLKHRDRLDYVTNALKTTYPPGAEVSVYQASTLMKAETMLENAALREHVGIHIYQKPDVFRIENLEAPAWLTWPDIHFEVDTDEDFDLLTRVITHFWESNPGFSLGQAIDFVRSSGLDELNADVPRRWKAFRKDDESD